MEWKQLRCCTGAKRSFLYPKETKDEAVVFV